MSGKLIGAVIVVTALVLLIGNHATLWLTIPGVIIIGREIVISALREWMAEIGSRTTVAVSEIGKIKTAMQMVAISLLLYRDEFLGLPIYTIGQVLLYLAVVLTLWSMTIYLRAAWPSLRGGRGTT